MPSRYDLEAIGRDYRAGILSIREVARQHEIDHSYLLRIAKTHRWKRDLSQRIKEEVTRKLVTSAVTVPSASDDEIIDTESERVTGVLKLHRKDVAKSQGLVTLLQGQLEEAATLRNEIEKTIEEGDTQAKQKGAMLRAISLPSHAGVLRDLSVAQKNLIYLERQAYSLEDKTVEKHEIRLTAYPSGPMTLAEWTYQMAEVHDDENPENTDT